MPNGHIDVNIDNQQLSLCWIFRARAASVSHGVSRRGLFFVSHDTPKHLFDSKNDYTFTYPHEPMDHGSQRTNDRNSLRK